MPNKIKQKIKEQNKKALESKLLFRGEAFRKKVEEELKKDEKRKRASLDLRVLPETLDAPSRTMQLVATTNYPYHYRGFFYEYEELLEISEEAIKFDRLKMGKMPVLKDHDNKIDAIVGRVLDYKIERGVNPPSQDAPSDMFKGEDLDKLIVTVHIADNDRNNEFLWPSLQQGLVKNVSIGYSINDYEFLEMPDYNSLERLIAKSWELYEVSFVAVPADHNAGVRGVDSAKNKNHNKSIDISKNLKERGEEMNEEEKKELEAKLKAEAEAKAKAEADIKIKEAKEKANAESEAKVKAERERAAMANTIASETGLDAEELINSKKSIEEMRKLGYEKMKEKLTEVKSVPAPQVGTSGKERKEKDFQDLFLSKLHKKNQKNIEKPLELEAGNEFSGMKLVDAMLKFNNDPWADKRKFLKENYFGQVRVLGQGSFPNVIEDAMNRQLNDIYTQRDMVFDDLTETVTQDNLHPHKQRRFDIDGTPDAVGEGEDIKVAKHAGEGNEIEVVKYAKGFPLTEEAMLNDDLSAFDRIMFYLGRGMSLREIQLIAKLLFTDEFDGAALYSANRKNLVSETAGGITLANVKALRTQMRKQETPAGKPMDIYPAFLLCGEDLAEDAAAFLTNTVYPHVFGDGNASARRGIQKVISHPYIDAQLGDNSDTDFVLAANPMEGGVEIVKRVIHSSMRVPEVFSDWNVQKQSMLYFSKFYLGIGLGDYRGLAKFQQS